jgi:hypothetical protein
MFILGKVYWTKYLDHLHNGGTKLMNSLKHSRVQIKQIFEQIYSIKVIWRLSTPLDEGCRKRDIRLRSPPMLSHHSKSHEKWGGELLIFDCSKKSSFHVKPKQQHQLPHLNM